jgi:hypothetical protein
MLGRSGSASKALKEFKVLKATYYKWKKIFDKDGEEGLLKKHLVATITQTKLKRESLKKCFCSARNISWAPDGLNGT